jgi:transcriptional regulator with XRE-family HTH domain
MTGISYHDRLRRARLDAGLSQLELALRSGLSTSTISAVEQGSRDISAPRLFAWARACGASLDDIAGPDARQPANDPSAVPLDLEAIA